MGRNAGRVSWTWGKAPGGAANDGDGNGGDDGAGAGCNGGGDGVVCILVV